jgi:hypothetical protein
VAEDDLLSLVRPSDLASLRTDSVNLEMDGTKVRRSTPGERAAVVIVLPPQHFREHPRFPADDVLDLAAGAPTALVFELPDGTDEVELGDEGLLGLCERPLVNAVATEHGVVLPECLARLGGQARPVSVAQFAPEFDFTSQRWFADIRIDLFGAYFPMVRLAVVRYQPSSVAARPLPDGTTVSAHHYFVSPVVLLDPLPLFPDRRLTVQKVIKPTHSLLRLELTGTAYVATSSLDSEPDATARALARVTARPQSRLPVALAGGGEHWMNGNAIALKRDDPRKPGRLQLEDDQLRNLGPDVERILVVEEDHVPADPAVPSPEPFAAGTVFAAVVEGPFLPAP